MKNILLVAAFIFCQYSQASAQITLTRSSYPATILSPDSLKVTTYSSSFPSLIAKAGGIWDFSIVTDSTPVFYRTHASTAAYSFEDTNSYAMGDYRYEGRSQFNITTEGIVEDGIKIRKAEYSLTSLTSKPTDSIIIDSQYTLYSSHNITVGFPATYNASWTSEYSSEAKFQLSMLAFLYSYAPGLVKTYISKKDSVIGWGKVQLRDINNNISDTIDVLQVQTKTIRIDSFFINGAPFSNSLLALLSLTQGDTTTTYQQNYYRANEVTPLAQVTFSDSTYTQPVSAKMHVQRLIIEKGGVINAVKNVTNEIHASVYPNPLMGNKLSIDFSSPITKEVAYELVDINGNRVSSGHIATKGSQNHADIFLPASLPTGSYHLKLSSAGQKTFVTNVSILR